MTSIHSQSKKEFTIDTVTHIDELYKVKTYDGLCIRVLIDKYSHNSIYCWRNGNWNLIYKGI